MNQWLSSLLQSHKPARRSDRNRVQELAGEERLESRLLLSADGSGFDIVTNAQDFAGQGQGIFIGNSAGGGQLNQSDSVFNLDLFRADPRFAGIDGSGFAVAILDSGIDLDHPFFGPDLDGNGVADRIVHNEDFQSADTDADDVHGHGTNVSGIVASEDPVFTGVAPGVDIVALQVLNDTNGFPNLNAPEAALQWVVANAAAFNIISVNMSIGTFNNFSSPIDLGMGDEMAALDAQGVFITSSAGNDFSPTMSQQNVSYPAADPGSIGTGAVYDGDNGSRSWGSGARDFTTAADRIVSFSQRHATMTEIFAPGAMITSAGVGGGLSTFAGTSMASPQMAGVAALAQQLALQELGRLLSPDELLTLMVDTAATINDGDDEDDNVANTGLDFKRIDMLALGNAIWDMANSGLTEIHGVKWNDLNQNGEHDPGEIGLPGWTIFLDENGNGILDGTEVSTTTDTDGRYSFENLPPGNYTVAEVQQTDWTQTYPVAGPNENLVISFEFLPGPDGELDTPDDIFITAPLLFSAQDEQLSDQFASVGVNFLPNPTRDNVNEILLDSSFGTSPGSSPNLLTTFAGAGDSIEAFFDIDVFEVSAAIGMTNGGGRLTIFSDTSLTNPIGSITGTRAIVSLPSAIPIRGIRVEALVNGEPPTLDELSLQVSPSATQQHVINGDFESGSFAAWEVSDSTGRGSWEINDGTFVPEAGMVMAPINSGFDAVTTQTNPGIRELGQTFVVPTDITSAMLSWQDRIINRTPAYEDPAQEFRVLLLDEAGGLIQEIFSTNPGDELIQLGPNLREFDLTSLLQAEAGNTVELRFEEEDNLGFFNVTIDEIYLNIGSTHQRVPGDGVWHVTTRPNEVITHIDFRNTLDTVPGIIVEETGFDTVVSESGTQDFVFVSLLAPPATNVVIDVTTDNPLEASVSPPSLTFTPLDWDTPQLVIVTGEDDPVSDGDQLSNLTLSIDDDNSDPAYVNVQDEIVVVTTLDNEGKEIRVFETGSNTRVHESGTTDTFDVVLSARPLGPVLVDIDTDVPDEVTVSSFQLTFLPTDWDIPQTVTVTGRNDQITDGIQHTQISIGVNRSTSPPDYANAPVESITAITTDDEVADVLISVSDGATVVNENGSSDSFDLVLNNEPAGNVVLSVSSNNPLEAVADQSELTFTRLNWDVPQTVSVTGVDDFSPDGDQSSTISIGVVRSQSIQPYHILLDKEVLVTTVDDEPGRLDIDDNSVPEATTDGILTIRYMLGFTGTALTNDAVGEGAQNHTPEDIEVALDRSPEMLDADGNGIIEAGSDGILIIRYLFGFRDQVLVNNAVGIGATRTTGQQVADFLDQFMPGSGMGGGFAASSAGGFGEKNDTSANNVEDTNRKDSLFSKPTATDSATSENPGAPAFTNSKTSNTNDRSWLDAAKLHKAAFSAYGQVNLVASHKVDEDETSLAALTTDLQSTLITPKLSSSQLKTSSQQSASEKSPEIPDQNTKNTKTAEILLQDTAGHEAVDLLMMQDMATAAWLY